MEQPSRANTSVAYVLKSPAEIKNFYWTRPLLAIFLLILSGIFICYWTFVGIAFTDVYTATTILDIVIGLMSVTILYSLGTIGIIYFNQKMLNDGLPADTAATLSIILSNLTFTGPNSVNVVITWLSWFIAFGLLYSTPAFYKHYLNQMEIMSSSSQTVIVALNGVGGCNALYCSITSQAIMYNQTADTSTRRYQACESGFGNCLTPFLPAFAGFAEPQSVNSNPGFGMFEMSQIPGIFSTADCSLVPVDRSAFPTRNETWQGQIGQIMVNVQITNSTTTAASHQLQVYIARASLVWFANCTINFSVARANVQWKNDDRGTAISGFTALSLGPNPMISSLPQTFGNFDNNLAVPLQNTLGLQYSARVQYLSPEVVLNELRSYAQSYAAMTTIRSAYLDANNTASSTFSQGIQQPLTFTPSSKSFFLSKSVGIGAIVLLSVVVITLLFLGLLKDKPVFTGSSIQLMSLASGMNSAFVGGSSPAWMESKKVDTPFVKIRVKIAEYNESIENADDKHWHLEFAPNTSTEHVDLTSEEIKFLHRYKIE